MEGLWVVQRKNGGRGSEGVQNSGTNSDGEDQEVVPRALASSQKP